MLFQLVAAMAAPVTSLAFAAQETESGAISPRELEVLKSETDEVLRELRNAPLTVHRNSGGTAWSIKAGDVDKWTPEHQLIWVTIDTSANPVYGTGHLWAVDGRINRSVF